MPMTRAMRLGLIWFAKQDGPVALFDKDAPTNQIREKLMAQGYITRVPTRSMFLHLAITDKGRATLAVLKRRARGQGQW